jgi:hypothetical protein
VLVAAYDRVAAMRDTAGKGHAHSLPTLECRGSPWVNAKNGTVEEVMAGHRVLMLYAFELIGKDVKLHLPTTSRTAAADTRLRADSKTR